MARLRFGSIPPGVLTAAIDDADTDLATDNLTWMGAVGSPDTAAMIIAPDSELKEIVHVTAHVAGAGTGTMVREPAGEGTTARAWPAGTPIIHGPTLVDWADAVAAGGGGGGPVIVTAERTAGSLTLNAGTTMTAVTNAPDMVIPAVAGDLLEIGFNANISQSGNASSLVYFTMDGSTKVNPAGGDATWGVAAWRGAAQTAEVLTGLPIFYTVVAGDIFSGNVTLRLHSRRSASFSDGTINATTTTKFQSWVKNHGQ